MDLLKKLALLTIACVGFSYADQVASSAFRGLNNNEASLIIDPADAQDLLNVDVTAGGKSLKKRAGYGVYKALGSGQAMHGGFHAFNSSGNDYQLWGSSTSLFSIVNDGTPTTIVSSSTLNATWDCADSQGNSYCVNSSRDAYIRTDGTSMSWYTSPLGTMVEATPDRIVVAGVSGTPSTLYVSQANTFTNFTTGTNETDAFTEVIGAPGSRITHIRWGCGKLLWWKDASFGYLDFDDQFSAQIKTVSDQIGTFDNTSAIDPGGNVWFRGQDGHAWRYDCSALEKMSIDITPNTRASGNRVSNSWSQSTQSDFSNGLGFATFTDTTTTSGAVTLQRYSNVANAGSYSLGTPSQSTMTNVSGGLKFIAHLAPTNYTATLLFSSSSLNVGTSWKMAYSYNQPSTSTTQNIQYAALDQFNNGYECAITYLSSDPKYYRVAGVKYSSGSASSLPGSPVTTGTVLDLSDHTCEISINPASGAFSVRFDSWTAISGTDSSPLAVKPNRLRALFGVSNPSTYTITSLVLSASTGTYFSEIHNAPSLSTWQTFSSNNSPNGGALTYYTRSSTGVFQQASPIPWTAQPNNSSVSVSTGPYFQTKVDFEITGATQTPTLNDFTFNWFEGSSSDQSYMAYFDNAIWQTVAFGDGQANNNYIFKYDLINNGWTLYNFGAGGMLVARNRLYFGDTSAGNVFQYGTGTSDNGTAINAFWKSKDYSGSDPFLQSQLTNIDSFARTNSGTTLSVDYTVDTSTTTSYSWSLTNASGSLVQSRKLLPSGKLGQVFNIKYGDTSTSSAWEILGYRIGFAQQPYRPTQ